MPVKNGEAFLDESIQSILSQSFSDFEFLIINDGSTDMTEDLSNTMGGRSHRLHRRLYQPSLAASPVAARQAA